MGSVNGIQREKIRPRHAVIFSMPCAWRGVKNFCAGNALWMAQWHADYADTTGWPQIIFRFVAHSSKDCRDFAEKSKGFFFVKNITRCETMKYQHFFVFWCPIIEMLRRSAYPQASLVFCAHSFAFLCFCEKENTTCLTQYKNNEYIY